MRTVLEDVTCGHRGRAETVDEDRFELSLEEMDGEKCAYEGLKAGRFRDRLVEIEVDIRSQAVKNQCRNHKGSEILDDVDCSPSSLRTLMHR